MKQHIGLAVVAGIMVLGITPMLTATPSVRLTHAPHADSAAVAEVVNRFHRALATGDSSMALSLLSPDVLILESGGLETRNEYRSHHLPGDMGFARAVKSDRGPLKVTVEGSAAWTASTTTTQGQFNGRAINSLGAETMILSRTASGWKIRSIHWSSRNRRPAA